MVTTSLISPILTSFAFFSIQRFFACPEQRTFITVRALKHVIFWHNAFLWRDPSTSFATNLVKENWVMEMSPSHASIHPHNDSHLALHFRFSSSTATFFDLITAQI